MRSVVLSCENVHIVEKKYPPFTLIAYRLHITMVAAHPEPHEVTPVATMIGLDPDNPLLARAQAALRRQLQDTRLRLEGELREKNKQLSDAQHNKEDLGVTLFNFQQQLAHLQIELEKSHETHTAMASLKEEAVQRVSHLKAQHLNEVEQVKGERARSEKFQEELDRYVICT